METITGISVKSILKSHNNRDNFCELHGDRVRPVARQRIDRMLQCGEGLGYFTKECPNCGHTEHIAIACNSNFCNRCGRLAIEKRFNKLTSRLPIHIGYLHIFFTIPSEFRDFLLFFRARGSFNILYTASNETLLTIFRR